MKRHDITPQVPEPLLPLLVKSLPAGEDAAARLIRQGSVWLGKRRLRDPLETIGSPLVIFAPDRPVEEYTLDEKHIRYEDENILAVYKEGGVNTGPSPFSDYDCLTWGVQKYLEKKGVKFHVHAINRIDQPAQGLALLAKNKDAEKKLHHLFRFRKIHKLYRAVTPEFESDQKRWIFRDTLEWMGKQQSARTFVRHIGSKDNRRAFDAYPLTGRTHQIRKHFALYLRPIIGDSIYGGYPVTEKLWLCCYYYRFIHPFTEKKFEIEYLPDEYR